MFRAKIPFVISRLSILEHPLVRDVLAYLRLLLNPRDDLSFATIVIDVANREDLAKARLSKSWE